MSVSEQINLVEIEDIKPSLNSHTTLYMLEQFGATVKLKSPYPPERLQVQLWTNAFTRFNSEGNWHSIELYYQKQDIKNNFIFQGSFQPTSIGNYQFTYRIGDKEKLNLWQWLGQFTEDGYLMVKSPSPEMDWTQGASFIEVYPHVYVGNFIAASQADELGIDAVLNLADEFTLTFSTENHIVYKKLGLLDGAHHPIPDSAILAAISWINAQIQQGKQKILINCRAGIGRSGSVCIAYCFYKNPSWSYQKTLAYIWSKKANIYPHQHLQESLENLFPR